MLIFAVVDKYANLNIVMMLAKYKVIKLEDNDFPEACGRFERVIATLGFRPECIIGIESGGRFVTENILTNIPHEYIRLQRPSSSYVDAHRLSGFF